MKLKDFKKLVAALPEEWDELTVVISNMDEYEEAYTIPVEQIGKDMHDSFEGNRVKTGEEVVYIY